MYVYMFVYTCVCVCGCVPACRLYRALLLILFLGVPPLVIRTLVPFFSFLVFPVVTRYLHVPSDMHSLPIASRIDCPVSPHCFLPSPLLSVGPYGCCNLPVPYPDPDTCSVSPLPTSFFWSPLFASVMIRQSFVLVICTAPSPFEYVGRSGVCTTSASLCLCVCVRYLLFFPAWADLLFAGVPAASFIPFPIRLYVCDWLSPTFFFRSRIRFFLCAVAYLCRG